MLVIQNFMHVAAPCGLGYIRTPDVLLHSDCRHRIMGGKGEDYFLRVHALQQFLNLTSMDLMFWLESANDAMTQ